MSNKPILCLDFDGVIHSYTSGWKGADVIPDPPVEGAIAFMREAVKHFNVVIFSSRSNQQGGLRAMREWLGYHVLDQRLPDDEDLAWASMIGWPLEKPAAFVTIDDRALTFNGTWPAIEALKAFKPWNKHEVPPPTAMELQGRLALACATLERIAKSRLFDRDTLHPDDCAHEAAETLKKLTTKG